MPAHPALLLLLLRSSCWPVSPPPCPTPPSAHGLQVHEWRTIMEHAWALDWAGATARLALVEDHALAFLHAAEVRCGLLVLMDPLPALGVQSGPSHAPPVPCALPTCSNWRLCPWRASAQALCAAAQRASCCPRWQPRLQWPAQRWPTCSGPCWALAWRWPRGASAAAAATGAEGQGASASRVPLPG